MPRPGPSFVTLPRRKPATLAADERGRWPDRWCVAGSQDHGGDVCRRTGPATPMGGRAGLGAVGAGHARAGRGALDGSPDDPGRPSGSDRMGRPTLCRGAGLPDRNHRRGAGGQPPPRHPVGGLLLGFPPPQTASGVIAAYVTYGLLARPGALPAAATVARYYPATGPAALALLSLVLLLTPTGSPPSP